MAYQHLDSKDYEIIKELDINFRKSFSKIAKKVKLSKNSVSLRFEKLKQYMLHNVTGINIEILGYTMVKVYYTFDFYEEKTEKDIINELKKYDNILWAARMYGIYDLCVCFLINNLNDLIKEVNRFNEKFSKKINQKEIEIVVKQIYLRHNYLHNEIITNFGELKQENKIFKLDKVEKKILSLLRYNPRLSLIEISKKTSLSPKTISNKIKYLEKNNVITGYFMTLDTLKLDLEPFKILLQIQNLKDEKEFEEYLRSIKNIHYISKTIGLWDYEIDFVYKHINELQERIDLIKQKYPNVLKKINIISFGKRILTNKENFLK